MDPNELPQNDDDSLNDKLKKDLFPEWKEKLQKKFDERLGTDEEFRKKLEEIFKDEPEKKKFWFITDGALPGYFNQKLKILLIAREMHTTKNPTDDSKYIKDNPEERNIVEFVKAFLSGQFGEDSDRSTEAYAVAQIKERHCWKLAARIAYSVLQGRKLDSLDELSIEDIRKAYNKISFAILEMSKYNNIVNSISAPGISDYFKDFAEQSLGMGKNALDKNFIRKEIELLNPDLIISWNIRSVIAKKRFNKLLTGNHKQDPKEISCNFLPDRAWTYKFDDGREIPLLDAYHFSTMNKSPKKDIYDPVMTAFNSDVVQNLIAKKKAQDKKKI